MWNISEFAAISPGKFERLALVFNFPGAKFPGSESTMKGNALWEEPMCFSTPYIVQTIAAGIYVPEYSFLEGNNEC